MSNNVDDRAAGEDIEVPLYPYADVIITIYHNDTWAESFHFEYDGVSDLDTVIAKLVKERLIIPKRESLREDHE